MYYFLASQPKLRWATNLAVKVKSISPKKRSLDLDTSDEQLENTPLAKRQSPLIQNSPSPPPPPPPPESIKMTQPSVIDDEELDFL